MRLFRMRPTLLKAVHSKGYGVIKELFHGEGSLHVLAANRREEELVELLKLAKNALNPREFTEVLMQKCAGKFFQDPPMKNFGATPIAYAAFFGLKRVFDVLFLEQDADGRFGLLDNEQKQIVINGQRGSSTNDVSSKRGRHAGKQLIPTLVDEQGGANGNYPIHAVVASGRTEMFDVLIDCGAYSTDFGLGLCPLAGVDNLTPLQLAAKLGKKRMFKHILKRRAMLVWKWGPVAEHKIPLQEIDSSCSEGKMTVMEILVQPFGSPPTKEFLLPSFMNGFLFNLYKKKWKKTIRVFFWGRLLVLYTQVILLTVIAAPSIFHPPDGVGSSTTTENQAGSISAIILTCVLSVYELLEMYLDFKFAAEGGLRTKRDKMRHVLASFWERGSHILVFCLAGSMAGCTGLLTHMSSIPHTDTATHAAAFAGPAPGWVRACLGFGSLAGWIILVLETYVLVQLKYESTFLSVLKRSLLYDVGSFLSIYIPVLFGFTTGINALFAFYPSWQTRWGSWWSTLENLFLLSFIQEPPEIFQDLPYPSASWALFGDLGWAQAESSGANAWLPCISFYTFFVLYLIVSVVLLINLLIAMMSSRYETMRKEGLLSSRVSFGRVILRFERMIDFGHSFVHSAQHHQHGSDHTALGVEDTEAHLRLQEQSKLDFYKQDTSNFDRDHYEADPEQRSAYEDDLKRRMKSMNTTRVITFRSHQGLMGKSDLFDDDTDDEDDDEKDTDKEAVRMKTRFRRIEKVLEELPTKLIAAAAGKPSDRHAHAPHGAHEAELREVTSNIGKATRELGRYSKLRAENLDAHARVVEQTKQMRILSRAGTDPLQPLLSNINETLVSERGALDSAKAALESAASTAHKISETKFVPSQHHAAAARRAPDLGALRKLTSQLATRGLACCGRVAFRARVLDVLGQLADDSIVEGAANGLPPPLPPQAADHGGDGDCYGEPPRRRRFVSHMGWPASQRPFVSYAPPHAYEDPLAPDTFGALSLALGNLRGFCARLFSSAESDRLPGEAIALVGAALDEVVGRPALTDELSREHRLADAWLSWFGRDARPVHALIVVDVQRDFIDGTLKLSACAANDDGAAVVPVINNLRRTAAFGCVAVANDCHPPFHCSFHHVATSPDRLVRAHSEQDDEGLLAARPFERVILLAPDGTSRMPQVLWPVHCVQGTTGAALARAADRLIDITLRKGAEQGVDSHSAFCDAGRTTRRAPPRDSRC